MIRGHLGREERPFIYYHCLDRSIGARSAFGGPISSPSVLGCCWWSAVPEYRYKLSCNKQWRWWRTQDGRSNVWPNRLTAYLTSKGIRIFIRITLSNRFRCVLLRHPTIKQGIRKCKFESLFPFPCSPDWSCHRQKRRRVLDMSIPLHLRLSHAWKDPA